MERSAHRSQRLTVLAVIALVLFGIVTIVLDRAQIVQVLGRTNWVLVIPALLFTALSYFFLSYTFAMVCRIFGVRLGGRDLFEIGFVSWALNHLLAAGGAAGYSLRMLLIKRRGLPVGDVLAASLFHSTLNNLVLLILLPVGLLLGIAAHPLASNTVALIVAAALVALVLTVCAAVAAFAAPVRSALFRWISRTWRRVTGRDISEGLGELDATLGRGVRALKSDPARLVGPLVFIVGDWGASIAALWFCFDALGQPVGVGILIAGFRRRRYGRDALDDPRRARGAGGLDGRDLRPLRRASRTGGAGRGTLPARLLHSPLPRKPRLLPAAAARGRRFARSTLTTKKVKSSWNSRNSLSTWFAMRKRRSGAAGNGGHPGDVASEGTPRRG